MTVPTTAQASLLRTSPIGSAVITIPGSSSIGVSRRHAKNTHAGLSAYVVGNPKQDKNPDAAISVSMKKGARLLGLSLKGHDSPVVDLEFLATKLHDPVHVLGSCDQDGIVFLWFVYVERDDLGIDKALRLLRKYSFYSLRRSKAAFYSRIRLSGTSESGTMVLVPNDGSNCRVVTFHCEPADDPNGKPNVPVIAPPPVVKALPAPEDVDQDDDIPSAPEPPAAIVNPEQGESAPITNPIAEQTQTFVDSINDSVPPAPASPTEQDLVDEYVQEHPHVEQDEEVHEIEDVPQGEYERASNGYPGPPILS